MLAPIICGARIHSPGRSHNCRDDGQTQIIQNLKAEHFTMAFETIPEISPSGTRPEPYMSATTDSGRYSRALSHSSFCIHCFVLVARLQKLCSHSAAYHILLKAFEFKKRRFYVYVRSLYTELFRLVVFHKNDECRARSRSTTSLSLRTTRSRVQYRWSMD